MEPNISEASDSARAPGARAIYLTNRLPFPLDDGWKVRTFHVLRQIAGRMPVTVITYIKSSSLDQQAAFLAALPPNVRLITVPEVREYSVLSLTLGLFSRYPIQYWNNRSRRFAKAVQDECERAGPCIGIAVCAFMFPYLSERLPFAKRIVDTHNIDSLVMSRYLPRIDSFPKRLYARVTQRRLKALERDVYEAADGVWVCSDDERAKMTESSRSHVRTVPNGVDATYFKPKSQNSAVPGRLLFFGKLNYFPNIDAVRFLIEEILPLLPVSTVSVKLLGDGASRDLREMCEANPSVELVGRVDDVRPWLASADIVIVPLRVGGGTRLKILEAMAAGRPVLSTPVGAEGIHAVPDVEIMLADNPAEFAQRILEAIADPVRTASVGEAARRAIEARYDWDSIGRTMESDLAI